MPRTLISWRTTTVAAVLAAAAGTALTFALASEPGRPADRSASELAAERARDTSSPQAAILADGSVTAEEYESAVDGTIACIAARGFTVSEPRDRGDGTLEFTYETTDSAEGAKYRAAYEDCYEQNQRDVDLVWSATLAEENPPTSGAVAVSRAAIAECLGRNGVPGVGSEAALAEMLEAVGAAGKPSEVFYRCAGEAQAEHGVVPTE